MLSAEVPAGTYVVQAIARVANLDRLRENHICCDCELAARSGIG